MGTNLLKKIIPSSFDAHTNITDYEDFMETFECLVSLACPFIDNPLQYITVTFAHTFICRKCRATWTEGDPETVTAIPIIQFLQKT